MRFVQGCVPLFFVVVRGDALFGTRFCRARCRVSHVLSALR